MADPLDVSLADVATVTSGGSAAGVDIGARRSAARLFVDTLAASGTGIALSIDIETSARAGAGWKVIQTLDASNVGRVETTVAGLQEFVRVSWRVAGTTPSFDFAVGGTAHVLYAEQNRLTQLGVNANALEDVDPDDIAAGCLAATDEADGYIARRYVLPLVSWSSDLERFVAAIAAYEILSVRGFDPNGRDELVVRRAMDARTWLGRVGSGAVSPAGIVDSAPVKNSGAAARVTTGPCARRSDWDC